MFNHFIIWLPASIVVIYVVYIMGSYFICGNELISINYDYYITVTKSKFVNEVVKWCFNNMEYPSGHKYYPQVKICYYKTKRNRFGDYSSNIRLIRIFINNHFSVEELINTIIHEYTHYLDMPTQHNQKEYSRYLKQIGYFENPYEINARESADKYTPMCLKEMKRLGFITR